MASFFSIILFLSLISYISTLTEIVWTTDCFGIPNSPLSITAARILPGTEKGQKLCFYAPPSNEHYFSILINNLNLAKINNVCPTLIIEVYLTIRSELEQDNYIQLKWDVPEDPKVIFKSDCNDYKSKIGNIVQTLNPGEKLMVKFNPGNEAPPRDAFFITASSYVIGQSYNCPADKFRCWSSSFRCIDTSLVCDNVDNCYDNSDENDYRCTGRIGDIPMPLFVIIIISAILLLIFIIMAIILFMRNRKSSNEKDKPWRDMNIDQYEDEGTLQPSYIS